jgi:hypothetical protein
VTGRAGVRWARHRAARRTQSGCPVLAVNKGDRLELFMLKEEANTNGVWHRGQKTPDGDWPDWIPLGRPDPDGFVASIAVAPNADGRLLLVANPAGDP